MNAIRRWWVGRSIVRRLREYREDKMTLATYMILTAIAVAVWFADPHKGKR